MTTRSLAATIRQVLDLAAGLADGRAAAELAGALHGEAGAWFAAADSDAIDIAVRLTCAAIDLELAARALALSADAELAPRVAAIGQRLAQGCLFRALAVLSRPSHVEDAQPLAAARAAIAIDVGAAPAAPPPAPIAALRNVATFHREHERYYVADNLQAAAELYREANRLRVVAAAWQRTPVAPALDGIDLQQPAYEAVGCVDLSEPSAVAAIGVLFMEGGAPPSELRVLAAKLASLAAGWTMAGRWLADKMTAAWSREQSLFTPRLISVAQARFNTIATNWRGSRELQLAGKLVGLAHDRLQRLDLRPAAIRARRSESADELLQVAAILAMAAQLKARIGADLADNDRNWTAYLDGLPS